MATIDIGEADSLGVATVVLIQSSGLLLAGTVLASYLGARNRGLEGAKKLVRKRLAWVVVDMIDCVDGNAHQRREGEHPAEAHTPVWVDVALLLQRWQTNHRCKRYELNAKF